MPFRVVLTAESYVTCTEWVDAKDAEEAKSLVLAKARGGDVEWNYNGVQDDTIVAEVG